MAVGSDKGKVAPIRHDREGLWNGSHRLLVSRGQVKRFPLVGSFFSHASAARGIRQAVRYAWIEAPFAS